MSESRSDSQVIAPAAISATRRLYWSVRRELWENRSIYIAPLAVAASVSVRLPDQHDSSAGKDARRDGARSDAAAPVDCAALRLRGRSDDGDRFCRAVFYCLDALHGERRDRSILFWKSLPVSDLTTVLSKASIPLVMMPLLIFAITVAMQWIMLLLSSAVLLGSGQSVATLWTQLSLFRMSMAAALPPCDRPRALVRADLWLAAAGLRLGAARAIPMGRLAAARDRRGREDCLQHFAFRRPAGVPHGG